MNHQKEFLPIYQKFTNLLRKKKNIKGDVLVETAEDETVIIGKCEWDVRRDEGWGWCGREGDDHCCNPAFVHAVGDGEEAYAQFVEAFQNNGVAGFARVILINPVHQDMPPLVVLLQAVCSKFDHQMVKGQWDSIKQLYNQHLLDVLGPLVGHASDGDSRRRKLHLANSTSRNGIRYKVNHENFSYSGKLVDDNGKKFVEDLSDQDFIHNDKKLVNHLMHPSRILSLIGGNL